MTVEIRLGVLLGVPGAGEVDVLRPLKGSRNKAHLAVRHRQHAADAGSGAHLAVHNQTRLSHAQHRHIVAVSRLHAHVAAGGADADALRLSVKDHAVRGDDLQGKASHSFAPSPAFATTSSMVPA